MLNTENLTPLTAEELAKVAATALPEGNYYRGKVLSTMSNGSKVIEVIGSPTPITANTKAKVGSEVILSSAGEVAFIVKPATTKSSSATGCHKKPVDF